jgi:serine phosphatase RsbU (regulator of sigma subunit)
VNTKVLAISILLLASKVTFSKTDSLVNFIQQTKDVNEQFEAINLLVSEELNVSPEKAYKFSMLQLKLVKIDSQVARAYLNVGLSLDYQSKYDSAITFYNKSLILYQNSNNEFWQAQVLLNLGVVNYYKGDYDAAVQYYFNALKNFEKIGDKNRMSAIYNNIGSIYEHKNQFLKAIKYHRKSLLIAKELNDSSSMSSSYNNLGISYRNLSKYDSSLFYYEKSLLIKKMLKDERGIARSFTNIGQLYFFKKDYRKALKYNIDALAIERKINNKRGICESYINIGEGYLKIEDLNSASFYLDRGFVMAKELGAIETIVSALEGLAAISAKKGDYKKAFHYFQDYSLYKDSLLNEETNRQIAKLDAIYENDSKRKEIVLLNKEKTLQQVDLENQKLQKIAFAIALSSVLIILIFIVRSFQQKKRANRLLATQKIKIEEKNTEITDSINYAKRIQQAVLKSEEREFSAIPEHFILFKPKDIVSGDFYWMLEKQDSIYLTVADCTGHGVPGAFMSMLGIAFLNEINANERLLSPAEILNQLREKIIKELGQKGVLGESRDGMDISLLRIDKLTNNVQWAGANNPFWVASTNNELKTVITDVLPIENSAYSFYDIKPNKQPIGYHVNKQPFTNHQVNLNKGDLLYLFTDGYPDQFGGEKGKKFMKKRFKELLIKNIELSILTQKEELDLNFENWRGDLEQLDDVCVIGIKL